MRRWFESQSLLIIILSVFMFQISFSRWSSFGEDMNLVVFGLISFLVLITYVVFVGTEVTKKR